MTDTQESETVSTKSQRIAELARAYPQRSFTSLAHHIDLEWMREAYRRTRKNGAAGVDGVTASAYEADLEANLADLLERLKSGRYRLLDAARGFRLVCVAASGPAGARYDARVVETGAACRARRSWPSD